jgi:hypothetical protein
MKTKTAYCKLLLQIVPLLLLLFLLPAGCELEYVDYGRIESSDFPKTEEDAQTLLNYMYHHFTREWDGIFDSYALMSEHVTDICESAWEGGRAGYLYNYYEADELLYHSGPDNSSGGTSPYESLPLLSTLILDIDRMNTVEFDETRKARYIAELKCGMGWLAFLLYDCYGPVPLPTLEILKDPLRGGGIIIERVSEEEMQEFIETNLKDAAAVLPYDIHSTRENKYSSDDYGRFHKGLANFALMKFYMLMERWDDAEKMGRELMKPEYGYRLMPDYNGIFTLGNEKNAEIIYAGIQVAGGSNNWFAATMPSDYDDGLNLVKWGGIRMSWPFYGTFEPGDARTQRIIAEYTATDGVVHNKAKDREGGTHGTMYVGPYPVKYDWTAGATGTVSEIDWIVYRYADVVTLLAEAIVRNGGDMMEAMGLLNQVRTRALGEAKKYTMADFNNNVDIFLEKLLLERGHEFYFEGVRRQDLIRHGKLIEFAIEKNKYASMTTTHLETPEGAIKYGKRFAIPMYYVIQSKGYIQQNPGF